MSDAVELLCLHPQLAHLHLAGHPGLTSPCVHIFSKDITPEQNCTELAACTVLEVGAELWKSTAGRMAMPCWVSVMTHFQHAGQWTITNMDMNRT